MRRVLAILWISLRAAVAWAEPAVTLETQPAAIEVPPWEQKVEARIVLHNNGNERLVKPALACFTNNAFHVAIGPEIVARLAPHDTLVWNVKIDNLGRARIPGSLQFEASYGVAGKSGVQRLYTTLKVQRSAAAEKPIEVSVQGSFDAITDKRPGIGYVVVTNNLDVPIRIAGITIQKQTVPGSFKDLEVVPLQLVVSERSSGTAAITLKTADKVTPGKQTIIFDVEAAWDQGGHHTTRHVLVSKDVDVGVFFESEILKALGVPSFLLLPGCLFLFTMQLLLALGLWGLDRHSKPPDLPVTSPGFWIVAITFSSVFAWIYTRWTGNDYLTRYGARDLRNVWIWSIVIGFLFYSAIALVTSWQRWQRVPSTKDDEIGTLLKMGRRGAEVYAKQVRFKLQEVTLRAFLIEPIEDGQPKVWVAPAIQTTWGESKEALAAQERVTRMIDERRTALEIGEALRAAKEQQHVTVNWETTGSVPNPYHLNVQDITAYDPRDQIVTIA
jgi:copper(I)-binding protein